MPELPEVETVRRGLVQLLPQKTVVHVCILTVLLAQILGAIFCKDLQVHM